MIIDCHGHYTTAPGAYAQYHRDLLAAEESGTDLASVTEPAATDQQIREGLEAAQLRRQRERGTDLTIFSPKASGMAHHLGSEAVSKAWSRVCNDLIHRVCTLYPRNFAAVCQLPQTPGVAPHSAAAELRRCVEDMGFVGCNLNPDPSGGWWTDPPITDRHWYPLYEAMVELDVPAMIHVSASCNPNFHATGAHYLNADTAVFMQLVTSKLFEDFPTLRLIIPHGGGAVPYHWGRYRGIAIDHGFGDIESMLTNGNVFFDTCVYHLPGMRLLTDVIPAGNLLFASEMVGAARSIDPKTGFYFDDTSRYVDALTDLSDLDRDKIYSGNARRVFPRLDLPISNSTN